MPDNGPREMVKRIEMNLGYSCNNNCLFCGEGDNRELYLKEVKKMVTEEQIKADISNFSRLGYNHLTFLGGEPTIRKDFLEIVKHARKTGFITIFLTTNGRMMSNIKFACALFEAGLTEVCLSLHGAGAQSHDFLTRTEGSFDQVRAAMDNLAALGREFSTSTVIAKQNVEELPAMIRLLAEYRTRRILLSYPFLTGNALSYFDEVVVRFKDSRTHVIEAIKTAKSFDRMITIGHVPLCQIPGYEGYADILYWKTDVKRVIKKYKGKDINPDGSVVDRHGSSKIKKQVCRPCRYYYICEGIDHRYDRRFGSDELKSVAGEKITDPETVKSTAHFYNNIDRPLDPD